MRWIYLVFCLALAPAGVSAQDRQKDAPPPSRRWEITPYVGAAINSPRTHFIGVTPDRNHLFLGIHASVPVVRTPHWTFHYAPEIVPLILISGNPRAEDVVDENGRKPVPGDPGPVVGFGASPIGLEAQRHLSPHVRVFTAGAMGLAWFTRSVPVPSARRFNYTFEVGAGIQWQRTPRTALRFGYKLHHLSNNYSAAENPGLDGHVFLVGVSWNPSPAQEDER
jgi:hypothetical protein